MKNYPKFKAAAVQAAPVFLDADATADKAVKLIDPAGHNSNKTLTMTVDRRSHAVATFRGEEACTCMDYDALQADE